MVATHFFHKLVNNARLLMKKASWGCFVLVFDSSSEPAGHPGFSDSCAPGCSVVPGLSLKLGARHVRTVLAPQYMLPWITSRVCIVLRVVLGEIWVSVISVRFKVQ